MSVFARDSRSVHCLYVCQPVTATVPSWSLSFPPWVNLLVQGICQCLSIMVRSPSCVCLCVTVMGLLCLPVTFRPLDWQTRRCSFLPWAFPVSRGPRPWPCLVFLFGPGTQGCLSVLSFIGTGAFGMTGPGPWPEALSPSSDFYQRWLPNAYLPG